MTSLASTRATIVRAFAAEQERTNAYIEIQTTRAAEAKFGRQSSCAACTETTKHCCRMLVMTSLLDAVPIAQRVLDRRDDALVTLLHAAAERQRSLTADEWWSRQEPCPFLADERCSIYDIRPLPCRVHSAWSDPRCCSGWNKDKLVTSDQGLSVSIYTIERLQRLQRNLFGRAAKLPYADTLPASVCYAIDALQSKTEHRLARRLAEATTDLQTILRHAQTILRHAAHRRERQEGVESER
jgi:Fe-S-cluster containining protein